MHRMEKKPLELKKLTPEQMAAAIAWLEKYCNGTKCPMCGHAGWGVDQNLARLGAVIVDGPPFGDAYTPVLTIRCLRCSFIAQFDVTAMGVLPSGNASSTADAAATEGGGTNG